MIARLLQPFLIALVAVLGVSAAVQSVRLSHAKTALADLQHSIVAAAQKAEQRATTTGQEAVSDYAQDQQQDAPVIERVVTRTRNVCLRPADHLPVPAVPAGDQQAAATAQDDADRAVWLGVVADDLKTCATALNVCRAQYDFHNANTGPAK